MNFEDITFESLLKKKAGGGILEVRHKRKQCII